MDLLLVIFAGAVAAGVDGALGMGFGPTSNTILLSGGVPAPAASAMVNLVKVVTGVVSGASHWRLGNVDRALVARLALPGVVGAALGGLVLATVDPVHVRTALAVLLLAIGTRLLLRFSAPMRSRPAPDQSAGAASGLRAVGLAGGMTNGLVGAWGPVVTPSLMQRGVAPNVAVGTANTAEVVVAVTAVGSLVMADGVGGVRPALVGAMLVGGIVAAPLAAIVVRYLPARALGLAVAALLLVTQVHELLRVEAVRPARPAAQVAVGAAVLLAALRPRVQRARTERLRGRLSAAATPPGWR